MLRQKQLFDTMCSTLNDECLLLTSAENNHRIQSVGAIVTGNADYAAFLVPDRSYRNAVQSRPGSRPGLLVSVFRFLWYDFVPWIRFWCYDFRGDGFSGGSSVKGMEMVNW
ncbi:ATPase [Artemisia annua]|uniref:ATPase n=1 Tax=Artemisia annua TaxID=35608 RepID=A0A2U1M3W3_ARTAN|nr:ATPase [Artemisia annua]